MVLFSNSMEFTLPFSPREGGQDFPCHPAGKESTCNVGNLGSITVLGRSPGEVKGYPLQYFGLENSMDHIVHGVTKSQTRLNNFHFHFSSHICLTLSPGLWCDQLLDNDKETVSWERNSSIRAKSGDPWNAQWVILNVSIQRGPLGCWLKVHPQFISCGTQATWVILKQVMLWGTAFSKYRKEGNKLALHKCRPLVIWASTTWTLSHNMKDK